MEIPISVVQAVVSTGFLFVFKVVFGLINKNEVKSDEHDRRLEEKLRETKFEIKELERKFVSNDRELYKEVGHLREVVEYYKGLYEGHKEAKE